MQAVEHHFVALDEDDRDIGIVRLNENMAPKLRAWMWSDDPRPSRSAAYTRPDPARTETRREAALALVECWRAFLNGTGSRVKAAARAVPDRRPADRHSSNSERRRGSARMARRTLRNRVGSACRGGPWR